MHKLDVLTRTNAHGEPLFINKQIGATRWIPKGYDGSEAHIIASRFEDDLVTLILNPEYYDQ
jgi:hypothetical protein